MKLSQIIIEKLGNFVYTKQSVKRLSVILQTNKLIFDNFEVGDKTFYVLHTFPSRKDLIGKNENTISIIQLNGEKLNAEIKHKNVDHYLNSKNKDLKDDLYSDERIIPDAAKFIEQISILIQDEQIIPTSELKEIETLCKDKNIPLFFYNTKEDMEKNNRQKKIKLTTPDYNYTRQQFSKVPENLKALLYFSRSKDVTKIPDRYAKYLNELIIDQKRLNFIKKLKTEIKTVQDNPLGKSLVDKLFKQNNTEDLEVIVKKIATDWKSIINKHYKNQSK